MKIKIADIMNSKLFAEVCEKAKGQQLSRYVDPNGAYLCIKIGNDIHEHIYFKENHNVAEVRKQIIDLINKKLKIKSENLRVIASILVLSQIEITIDLIISQHFYGVSALS